MEQTPKKLHSVNSNSEVQECRQHLPSALMINFNTNTGMQKVIERHVSSDRFGVFSVCAVNKFYRDVFIVKIKDKVKGSFQSPLPE